MPFHPTPRPVVSVVADRIFKWDIPCVCGSRYGSFENAPDKKLRDIWDAIHNQHAAIDRYADEEKD